MNSNIDFIIGFIGYLPLTLYYQKDSMVRDSFSISA